jgi:hypothetical protein
MMPETERDVKEWLAANPTEASPDAYPKLMYNVNLPPLIVRDADNENALGEAWRQLNVGVIPEVAPVTIDPATADVPAAGGSDTFHVTITGIGLENTWTATKDSTADWLTVVPEGSQNADGDVTYTAAANLDVERTANIYVNGKTFVITQAAGV